MLRKRAYTFLYVPEDHAQTRRVRLTHAALVAGGTAVLVLALLGVGFLVSLVVRSGGPDPQALARENERLTAELARLEEKVALLHRDLSDVWAIQETVAASLGVAPPDPAWREAGIGGREPLPLPAGAGLPAARGERVARLDAGLERLVRQARLQNEGFQALRDTLAARAAQRAAIPSICPVDGGYLSSGYGVRPDPFTGLPTLHEGADFVVPIGSPVHATADGTVRAVGFERGYGHVVVVQHDARVATRYAHLSQSLVARGATVHRGDVIALSGKSGRAVAPHLHYEVLVNGRATDPLSYVLEQVARR